MIGRNNGYGGHFDYNITLNSGEWSTSVGQRGLHQAKSADPVRNSILKNEF
jgi:hypothetical protein